MRRSSTFVGAWLCLKIDDWLSRKIKKLNPGTDDRNDGGKAWLLRW
jgi:hypothetical protein